MSELSIAIPTGLTAFVATNLDDIVILSLFFSQVNTMFRRRHIVVGQYFGFSTLVLASLPAFFGSLILPQPLIGLLGIAPIMMGINRLLNQDQDIDDTAAEVEKEQSVNSWFSSFLSPQTYSVAAVTIANGSDNIAIYAPLFASSTWNSLLVILAVFFSMVGVWCYTAYVLSRTKVITNILTRYGNPLIPFILIGLGVLIITESHTLENRGLAVLTLVIGGFSLLTQTKNIWRVPEVEN